MGWQPSLKSGEKEHSLSLVYVLHKSSYTGISRRSCALTAKICTVLLTKSIASLTLQYHCCLRCYKLPIMLVFQGNPMRVDFFRKKTFSFYNNKAG